MPMYLCDQRQIGFEVPDDAGDDWVRAYRGDDGVIIDRAGLCKLDSVECRQFAAWLLEIADEIQVGLSSQKPAKKCRGRPVPRGGRRR